MAVRAARSLRALVTLALLPLAGCLEEPAGGSAAPSGGSGAPTADAGGCAASPEMAVGPYFVEGEEVRRDIRSDGQGTGTTGEGRGFEDGAEDPDEEFLDGIAQRTDIRADDGGVPQEGVELRLSITVHELASGACRPMEGARVDVWHANAYGAYSGFAQEGTAGESWLRGAQVTDAGGSVSFTTIWPGWYPGRAVHIHVKVREGERDFTSQFFFDPEVNAQVMAQNAPYDARPVPNTPNDRDGIYRQGGNNMILVTQEEEGHYVGAKTIVVR